MVISPNNKHNNAHDNDMAEHGHCKNICITAGIITKCEVILKFYGANFKSFTTNLLSREFSNFLMVTNFNGRLNSCSSNLPIVPNIAIRFSSWNVVQNISINAKHSPKFLIAIFFQIYNFIFLFTNTMVIV